MPSAEEQRHEERRAREKVLRLLGRRDHFRAELAEKLRQAAFSSGAVTAALAYADGLGYFREADYAARLGRELLEHKGYAPARIRRELIRRGAPSNVAADAVAALAASDAEEGVEETARAAALLARRRYTPAMLREEKARRRAAGLLMRSGYGAGVIRRVLGDADIYLEE